MVCLNIWGPLVSAACVRKPSAQVINHGKDERLSLGKCLTPSFGPLSMLRARVYAWLPLPCIACLRTVVVVWRTSPVALRCVDTNFDNHCCEDAPGKFLHRRTWGVPKRNTSELLDFCQAPRMPLPVLFHTCLRDSQRSLDFRNWVSGDDRQA